MHRIPRCIAGCRLCSKISLLLDVNCGAEAPGAPRDLSARRYRITRPTRIVPVSSPPPRLGLLALLVFLSRLDTLLARSRVSASCASSIIILNRIRLFNPARGPVLAPVSPASIDTFYARAINIVAQGRLDNLQRQLQPFRY